MDEAEELASVLWRAFHEAIFEGETDLDREWDEIPSVTRTAWLAAARAAIAHRP